DAECIKALRWEPAIVGLTETIAGRDDAEWNRSLSQLEDHRLIAVDRSGSVDVHPLVREYFALQLQKAQPTAWRAAHERIYKFLCGSVEHQPDTLDRLQPLYQAIAHGCLAGRQEEACDEVYI